MFLLWHRFYCVISNTHTSYTHASLTTQSEHIALNIIFFVLRLFYCFRLVFICQLFSRTLMRYAMRCGICSSPVALVCICVCVYSVCYNLVYELVGKFSTALNVLRCRGFIFTLQTK